MTTKLALTAEDFQRSDTFERLDDPETEPVCATCGAPVRLTRAARAGRPVTSAVCTEDRGHLLVHLNVRLDDD